MTKYNFRDDINKILNDIIDLENRLFSVSEPDEVDLINNKISFAKNQLDILEIELGKINFSLSNEQLSDDQSDNSVETNNVPKSSSIYISESNQPNLYEIANNTPTEDLKESLDDSPPIENNMQKIPIKSKPTIQPKEPSVIMSFIKDNWKLLFFSTFLFVGIVWLFVYVSNLTNFAEELRIGAGFLISISIYLFGRKKKLIGNNAVITTLSSYIIGLLSLLFGSVVLEIIPQTLSIIISLIYIGFGIYHIQKLQSVLYEVSIISTSLLLTFAYRYVDAPYEILFIYILSLIVSITFAIQKTKSIISSTTLILFSLFITNIINSLAHSEEKTLVSSSFDFYVLLPFLILFGSAFAWQRLQNDTNNLTLKNISLGSLYVSLITFVLQFEKSLSETINNTNMIVTLITTVVLSLLFIFYGKKLKNVHLQSFSFVALFLIILNTIPHFFEHSDIAIDIFLILISVFLMVHIASKNSFVSLRFMSFYYLGLSTFLVIGNLEDAISLYSEKINLLALLNSLFLSFVFVYAIYVSKLFKEFVIPELKEFMKFVHHASNFIFSIVPFFILHSLFMYFDDFFKTDYFFLAIGHIILGFILLLAFNKLNSYYIRSLSSIHFLFIITLIFPLKSFPSLDSIAIIAFLILGCILTVSFNKLSKETNINHLIFEHFSKYIFSLFSIGSIFVVSLNLIHEFILWISLPTSVYIFILSLSLFALTKIATKFSHIATKIVLLFSIPISVQIILYDYIYQLEPNAVFSLVDIGSGLFIFFLGLIAVLIFKNSEVKSKIHNFIHHGLLFVSNFSLLQFSVLYAETFQSRFDFDMNISVSVIVLIAFGQILFSQSFRNIVTQLLSYAFLIFVFFVNFDIVDSWDYTFHFLDWFNISMFILLLVFEHQLIKTNYYKNKNKFNKVILSIFNFIYLSMFISFSLPLNDMLESKYEANFYIFNSFTLGLLAIVFYQLFSQSKGDNFILFKISRIAAQVVLLFTVISNLISMHYDLEQFTHFPFLLIEYITAIGFIFLTLFISKNYKNLKIDLLLSLEVKELNISYLRIPMALFSIFSLVNLCNYWFVSSYILTDNIVVGLSIIYLLFELSQIEKLKEPSKKLLFFVYSIIAVYLFILIFILLADTVFIIRAIVFIIIGIYGLFTVLKNNKKELD